MTIDLDKRALKILFDTYWTSRGWRCEKTTPASDLAYAKQAGVMFDSHSFSHSKLISMAREQVKKVSLQAVSNAFVASLSTRRLDLRSALGSYAFLLHLPEHQFPAGHDFCPACGGHERATVQVDLNMLSFERYKWGGVRHDDPLYAWFDLRSFEKLPAVIPTASDLNIFKSILLGIEAAPPETSSDQLMRQLGKLFRSNPSERGILIGILGLCGLLETDEHQGYRTAFVPWERRELPTRRFLDMHYPACWWSRECGLNQDALEYWFGHLL